MPARRARTNSRASVRRCANTALTGISSQRWMILPGCSICAARIFLTTRSSLRIRRLARNRPHYSLHRAKCPRHWPNHWLRTECVLRHMNRRVMRSRVCPQAQPCYWIRAGPPGHSRGASQNRRASLRRSIRPRWRNRAKRRLKRRTSGWQWSRTALHYVHFFAWFEQALGSHILTELSIDEQLTAARARQPDFISPSFATIAAFNANGAMPHYQASAASHARICGDGILLIDSGGHYSGGTTDITRVAPVGAPSAAQKRDFTLVLKGVIALSRARFPNRIRAPMLDALARAPLWAEGMDYGHGTGHGVGYCLNVHEGPQAISYRADARPETAMEQGRVTSIEPGIYRPGQWGVRIENLVLNRRVQSAEEGDKERVFLEFETLTLCPIDTRCIERDLLRADEMDWLNAYHAMVRRRLAPRLSGAARAWLEERTRAI